MTSSSHSPPLSRRQRRKQYPRSRPPSQRAEIATEPTDLGFDGGGDAQRLKRKNRIAMNSRSSKRRGASPFDTGANSDDNRQRKNNGGPFDRKPKGIVSNGNDFRSKKFGAAGSGNSRPGNNTPPYEVDEDAYPVHSETPGAMVIWNHLRDNGIFPPKWPDITDKSAMGRLRTDRDLWSQRALDSLAHANLVEAEGFAPRKLSEMIQFHGICEDLCPEAEMIMRIIEPDIPSVEKDANGRPDRRIMIKKAQRSAAGAGRPPPWDVRSTATIRRGVDYLIDDLLRSDENLPRVHTYIWDRTRELRRDFTYFTVFDNVQEMYDQVYVFENCVRFHVTSLHLLSRKGAGADGFSEQQELEQLSKSLISLMDTYELCGVKGIVCDNEAEFRAYYCLFFANSPNIAEKMQSNPKIWDIWKKYDIFRTAVSLMELLQNIETFHDPMKKSPSHAVTGMPSTYFRIIEDSSISYTMACFAEVHFGQIRRAILRELKKVFRRPKILSKDPTPALLNSYLKFDTDEEAVEFIEAHGLKFVPQEDASQRYLDVTGRMTQPRLDHAFSHSLVEIKRGNHSLPHVIHNTVFEGSPAAATSKSFGGEAGASFLRGQTSGDQQHVPVKESTLNSSAPFSGTAAQQAASDKPANPFSSASPAKVDSPFGGSPSPFGTPGQAATITASPFANTTPDTTSPFQNPFSSTPAAANSSFGTPPATTSPFGAPAPSSNGQSQTDTNGFKSPFTSATPAASPFSQPKATGPSPFSSATPAVLQQPAQPSETKGGFAASPFGGAPAPKTASPFAGLMSKPSDMTTKAPEPASTAKAAGDQSSKPGMSAAPQAASAFAKLPSPMHPQPTPPAQQQASLPPAFPTLSAPSLAQAPAPVFSFSVTQPGEAAPTSDLAPKAPTAAAPTTQSGFTPQSVLNTQQAGSQPASFLSTKHAQPVQSTPAQPPTAPSPASSVLAPATKPPAVPPTPPPPAPKRDLLGDFTRWFVQGDGGLLEEFKDFIIMDIVQKTYQQFQIDEAERLRKEEEEADLKKAREFQVYNLRVKFFYRWRNIARTLRLRRLRENDKREYREYMAAKHAEEMAAKEKAKRAAAKAAALAQAQKPDPVNEFKDFLQTRKDNTAEYETALLASGILSGVENEQQAASDIVRGTFKVPRIPEHRSSRKSLPNGGSARLSSPAQATDGAKTRALREQLAGRSSSSFRRSLPPGATPSSSWRASSSPSEQPKRVSKVSDRWRLKAMGLVTMPDGTALPEKLANSMRYDGVRYEGWGSFGLDGNSHKRSRSTSADLNHSAAVRTAFVDSFRRSTGAGKADAAEADPFSPPTTKRKRTTAEDEALRNGVKAKKQATAEDSIEKILREARELRGSLRSSRVDLDETTGWFREQSDIMQQEEMLSGRSSSAWGEE